MRLAKLLYLILFPLMGSGEVKAQDESDKISYAQKVASTGLKFSSQFYHTLRKTHRGNLITSPISLRTVIAMVQLGAKGQTYEEIKSGMNFNMDQNTLNEGYAHVLKKFQNPNMKYTLEFANRIYTMKGFQIDHLYLKQCAIYYNSSLITLDFLNQKEALQINEFVARKTRNKITNIIDPRSLDSSTRMILINALYFSGRWANSFDPTKTKMQPFYLETSPPIQVLTMSQKETYPYAQVDALYSRVVAIPYKGGDLELVIILPNKGSTLAGMERRLENFELSQIEFNDKRIELKIPKFKIETSIDLKQPLMEMGIQSLFDSKNADLSGINVRKSMGNLYVSKAIQKAYIEINENGTEAAAASVIEMVEESIIIDRNEPLQFFIDRPFYFYIWEKSLKIILFSGSVTKPQI